MPFIDAFIRSYLIGLGEFGMDNFGEQNGTLVWIFFLLATFITQLIFMNLLIAIMGDTFDRVQEFRVQAATKEKISMITDFIWVLDLQEHFSGSKYIALVEQQMIQGNTSVWEGKIGQLKNLMKHQQANTLASVKQQFSELRTQVTQLDY